MKLQRILFGACCLLGFLFAAQATVYFKEDFSGDWESRWVVSDWKQDEGTAGEFEVSAGEWYGDAEIDKGLRTTQDARFYTISAELDQEFSNRGKDLVLQFTVKHPQMIDCGGGYLKLLPKGLDLKEFTADTDFNIMFGPDICGSGKRITHLIFNYKGKGHLMEKELPCEYDQLSHTYTLILRPDQTYEIRIDGETKRSGSLLEDWKFLPPKTIPDPDAVKPEDWVEEEMIDDPEDTKPEDWDDEPAKIPDPEAVKPEDWEDDEDGEWEAPLVDNPEHRGEWRPRQIPNPEYKGPWEHPQIPNPEYEEDKEIYAYDSFGVVGINIWQVRSGTIFDNIIITDDIAEAEAFMKETWGATHEAEKEMFEKIQAEQLAAAEAEREAMRQAEEEARKAAEAAEVYDDEDDEDDDDDEEEEEEHVHEHHDL